MTDTERLAVHRDGPVLHVRFVRSPRPFLDERTGVELDALTRRARRDRTVRAVVFGGGFSSHADVGMLLRGARSVPLPVPYPAARAVIALADAVARVPAVDPLLGRGAARDLVLQARVGRALTRLTRSDVVTVVAIDGLAVGAGTVVALACDVRLMADDARTGLPEAALGMLAAAGGTQRLVHAVGTRPIRRGLAMEAAGLVTTLTGGAAEARLATYGRWLDEHPDHGDEVLRHGWTNLLGRDPDVGAGAGAG